MTIGPRFGLMAAFAMALGRQGDMKLSPKTKSMSVQLTYADGTQSPVRVFNAPK